MERLKLFFCCCFSLLLIFASAGCSEKTKTRTEIKYVTAEKDSSANKENTVDEVVDGSASSDANADSGKKDYNLPAIIWGSPVANVFNAGDNLSFFVSEDKEAPIRLVSFFIGEKKIADDHTPPYGIIWKAIPGEYLLSATAYDNQNQALTTVSKTIIVHQVKRENILPSVNFLYPGKREILPVNRIVNIEAEASDIDGDVALVSFFINDTPYDNVVKPPYATSWKTIPGEHKLSVRAIDNQSYSSVLKTQTIWVGNEDVLQGNLPPIADIISPHPMSTILAEDQITFKAKAFDPDGEINNIKLFLDGNLFESMDGAELSTEWHAIPGKHQLQIDVRDEMNAITRQTMDFDVLPKIAVSQEISAIHIDDPSLKNCIHETVKDKGWLSIEQITALHCASRNIVMADGIGQLSSLETLNIADNLLTQVDLHGLSKLKVLNISGNYLMQSVRNLSENISLIDEGNLFKEETKDLHQVALVFIRDKTKEKLFKRPDVTDRVETMVDRLLRSVSYNSEGIDSVNPYGWFELTHEDFNDALSSLQWDDTFEIEEAVKNDLIDLTPYDYVIVIWEDSENKQVADGVSLPHQVDLQIGQKIFSKKSLIHLFLNEDSMSDHCFYKTSIFSQPEFCYKNPYADNLKQVDVALLREFIRGKLNDSKSNTYFCENFITGVCDKTQNNGFDSLSAHPFFGIDVNAHNKYQMRWIDDDRVVNIDKNGVYPVKLNALNSQQGKVAIKIDFQNAAGFDLWLEYRLPSLFDYGLYHSAFEAIKQGVLIYKDGDLLDATPNNQALIGEEPLDIALTGSMYSEALGLDIQIEKVDRMNRFIDLSIVRTSPKPKRGIPRIVEEDDGCRTEGLCLTHAGKQFTAPMYQAELTDIGFGSTWNKLWSYRIIGLPEGLTYTDTGINRKLSSNPDMYTTAPHTLITFTVSEDIQPGIYHFIFRLFHPEDPKLYQDIPQWIRVD